MTDTIEQQQEAEPTPVPTQALLEPKSLAKSLVICASGWLVPGGSHFLLGRWGRGLMFAMAVLAMFLFGVAMHGRLYDFTLEQPLHIFAFLANAGIGLPYILAQRMGWGVGMLSSPTYDYGNTYLWVAGLLNYLIVLDAFDIAQGRKP